LARQTLRSNAITAIGSNRTTVRRRAFVALAVTTIVLIVVLCTISRLFLVQRFADLEAARMTDSVARAELVIQNEIAQLDKIAMDNAAFDDTYHFMHAPSASYIRSNFGTGSTSTLARENYQALVFIDPHAKVVAAEGYDPRWGQGTAISPALAAHFSTNDALLAKPLADQALSGFMLIDGSPMLISARPILTSESKGPVAGVLIMGSYLKQEDIQRLERNTHLTISVGRVDEPHLTPDFTFARDRLIQQQTFFVHALDDDTIAGYALFRDIYGKPALVLKVEMPRTVYRQGQLTLFYLAAALGIAGIAFGAVVKVLFERLLVSRLTALDSGVARIAESGDLSARVACGGDDELTHFAEAINRMLDSLQLSQAEKRQAEDRYRIFMDNSPLVAAIKDEAGRYVYVNEPFSKVFQSSLEQIRGGNCARLFSPETASQMDQHDREVLSCGELRQFEEVIPTPDGVERKWLSFRFPLPSQSSQRFIGLLSLDITEREKAAKELKDAKDAAEVATLVKSQFLSNISHEIRTPMNGIIGLTDLVLATPLHTEQLEHISLIKFSAESLLAIVNDVLDFSKLEAGKLELESVPFDLRKVLANCAAMVNVLAKRKGLEFVLDLPADLPSHIVGDATRLRQILLNLIGNAIKFTIEGEVKLSLVVSPSQDGGIVLHFTVADTGAGIPEDKKQIIFERFSQADASTTRQFGGTGLGLAISSRLVEMMAGRIWVESRIGVGSEFHFAVLTAVCSEEAASSDLVSLGAHLPGDSSADSPHSLKILIAEDNKVNQIVITRLLETRGHSTAIVDNGRKALQLLETEEFDLLITDVQMPEMDGYELVAAIRNRESRTGRRLPILGLTAHGFAQDRDKCLDAGMDAYLSKPVRSENLHRKIAELAGVANATRTPSLI